MRSKKAVKNIAVSALYQVVTIVCGLILPRLILRSFGSTYNGIVNSATQFLSFVQILNWGITGATKVAFYKTLAENDTIGTSRIYKATQNYMNKVAVVIVVYTAALMLLYPVIVDTGVSSFECTLLIAIIGIRTFAEYFWGMTNRTLITSDQRGYITFWFNIFTTVFNTAIASLLIYLKCSVFVVYFASSLIFLLNPLLMSIYVKKRYNIIKKCEPDNSALKARGAVAFQTLANVIHDKTDLILLSVFTDAKIVSVYSVYYLVLGKIKTLMKVFTNGIEASFGNMWVKKEYEALKRNFRYYEFAMYAFTTVVFSCVGVLIIPFVTIYTKGVTDVEYVNVGLASLITATEGIYCVRHPYLTLVYATGSYEQTKKGAAVEAALNVAVSLVLVNIIGIEGVVIGTLVANLFRTVQFSIYVSKHILERSITDVIKRVIWMVATSGIIVAVSLQIEKLYDASAGWMNWFIIASVVFAQACIITLISALLIYKSDIKGFMSVILRMFLKRKNK